MLIVIVEIKQILVGTAAADGLISCDSLLVGSDNSIFGGSGYNTSLSLCILGRCS